MKKIAYILLVLGLLVLAFDIYTYLSGGKFGSVSIAYVIFKIKASYLPLIQTVVERYISPSLWDYLVYPLISLPLWAILWGVSFILRLIIIFKDKPSGSSDAQD